MRREACAYEGEGHAIHVLPVIVRGVPSWCAKARHPRPPVMGGRSRLCENSHAEKSIGIFTSGSEDSEEIEPFRALSRCNAEKNSRPLLQERVFAQPGRRAIHLLAVMVREGAPSTSSRHRNRKYPVARPHIAAFTFHKPFADTMRLMKGGWVYIMTNRPDGTLYTGVTSDIVRRIYEHRNGVTGGFTARHHLHRLVWFEQHDDILSAIQREKAIEGWPRHWKARMIRHVNWNWDDLYGTLL
jgi:putative endonuclease